MKQIAFKISLVLTIAAVAAATSTSTKIQKINRITNISSLIANANKAAISRKKVFNFAYFLEKANNCRSLRQDRKKKRKEKESPYLLIIFLLSFFYFNCTFHFC
jgi:hypothetical protein